MAVQISGNDITVPRDTTVTRNLTVGGVLTYEDVTNVDSVGLITARSGVKVTSGDITMDTAGNITLGDSGASTDDRLVFGADSDLSIYHNGSNSYIDDSGTGNLFIRSNEVRINKYTNEYMIRAIADGAVELYHDNSKKLETTSTGVTVTGSLNLGSGDLVLTGNVDLEDSSGAGNNRIKLGASDDLQIYHASNIDKIESNGAGLHIRQINNGDVHIHAGADSSASNNRLVARSAGAAELYHSGTKKLETLTNGVQITGQEFISEGTILLEKSGAHHHRILSNDTGNDLGFQQSSDTGANTNFTTYLRINDGGNISLPVDNQKLRFGAGADLQIFHDASNSVNIIDGLYHPIELKHGAETHLKCLTDAEVQLYHNNVLMLSTASDGIQLQGADTKISRSLNGNGAILTVTNAQYAKALFVGGWEGGVDSSGISRVRNSNDNLHMDCGSLGSMYLNAYAGGVIYAKHFRPMTNDTYDLGGNGIRWDDVFATNGTINTSDRNEKNTITESDLGLSFVNKLKPVSYKFNGGTRTHYGLIAQDVETVLSDISKPSTDFAGFIKTDLPDEYYQEAEPHIPEGKKEGDLKSAAHTEYGLRYTEFISPLIKAVQELSVENAALKARLDAAGL